MLEPGDTAHPIPHAGASKKCVARLPPGRTYLLEFMGVSHARIIGVSWGHEPGGGGQAPAFCVARCRTWSHVDIRLVHVRSCQDSSGFHGDLYGSVSKSYTHTGPSSLPSGLVGSRRGISATSAKVQSGPKTSNLARKGSRITRLARNKDQMISIACADPSGPLLTPKSTQNPTF